MLALTILWHPDPGRIGEQHLAGTNVSELVLDRYRPAFCRPLEAPRPLGERCIAREPLRLRYDARGVLTLEPAASRMVVTLDGVVVT